MRHQEPGRQSFWSTFREANRRQRSGQVLDDYQLRVSDEGLIIEFNDYRSFRCTCQQWTVRWADIVKVEAWKADELTVDTIWIRLTDVEGDQVAWPDEAVGWDDAASALAGKLLGCLTLKQWVPQVAQPPFAVNYTVLFERADAAGGGGPR